MTLTAIDVSNNQGYIDGHAIAGADVDLVIHKATEGGTFVDSYLAANLASIDAAGLRRGFYHWGRPDTDNGGGSYSPHDAEREAAFFLRTISPYFRPGDIVVLDFEEHRAVAPREVMAKWGLTFLYVVEAELAVTPWLYTFQYWWQDHIGNDPRFARFPLWLASYGRNDGKQYQASPVPPWDHITMHQYTSQGSIPGVWGPCDVNVFYGDTADLNRLAGATTITTASTEMEDLLMPAAKDDDDARRCLIRQWYNEYLGRGPSGDEQEHWRRVFVDQGADLALAGIFDSEEAIAYRGRTADTR